MGFSCAKLQSPLTCAKAKVNDPENFCFTLRCIQNFSLSALSSARRRLWSLACKKPIRDKKIGNSHFLNPNTMANNFIKFPQNPASAHRSSNVKAHRSSNLGNPQKSLFDGIEDGTEGFYVPAKSEIIRRQAIEYREPQNMHFWQAVGMVDDDDKMEEVIFVDAENKEEAERKAEKEFALRRIYPIAIFIYNMD